MRLYEKHSLNKSIDGLKVRNAEQNSASSKLLRIARLDKYESSKYGFVVKWDELKKILDEGT